MYLTLSRARISPTLFNGKLSSGDSGPSTKVSTPNIPATQLVISSPSPSSMVQSQSSNVMLDEISSMILDETSMAISIKTAAEGHTWHTCNEGAQY